MSRISIPAADKAAGATAEVYARLQNLNLHQPVPSHLESRSHASLTSPIKQGGRHQMHTKVPPRTVLQLDRQRAIDHIDIANIWMLVPADIDAWRDLHHRCGDLRIFF
jgi:hypothetical protein